MSTLPQNCPRCTTRLGAQQLRGLCPSCLLNDTLSSRPPSPLYSPDPDELSAALGGLEVVELIGSGAMGAVYLALDQTSGQGVALKVLHPELASDPEVQSRFEREASTLAALDHPGIVKLHRSGTAGGFTFLVLEYIDGKDISQIEPSGVEETLTLSHEIARALDYAHRAGITHRDLKPANILLAPDGTPRITDFGLAKITSGTAAMPDDRSLLTSLDQAVGTPRYMAPEQWDTEAPTDSRCDIYALAAITYERLTGKIPTGKFPPPSELANVSKQVDRTLLRALESDPNKRFSTASEFAEALLRERSHWKFTIPLVLAAIVVFVVICVLAVRPEAPLELENFEIKTYGDAAAVTEDSGGLRFDPGEEQWAHAAATDRTTHPFPPVGKTLWFTLEISDVHLARVGTDPSPSQYDYQVTTHFFPPSGEPRLQLLISYKSDSAPYLSIDSKSQDGSVTQSNLRFEPGDTTLRIGFNQNALTIESSAPSNRLILSWEEFPQLAAATFAEGIRFSHYGKNSWGGAGSHALRDYRQELRSNALPPSARVTPSRRGLDHAPIGNPPARRLAIESATPRYD